MNRHALSKLRRWTASFALAGYGFVALAGHGMHAIDTCDHAEHQGEEFAGGQPGIAASHAADLHDYDHCVVCQFCAQAQLPFAQSDVTLSHHCCEQIAREPVRLRPSVSYPAYSPRGPPLLSA